jgi:hypothetical protein
VGKHKRELTIKVEDSLKVSFTESTSETTGGGVKRHESERVPMDIFGTPGALAQAVGLRLGSFLGEPGNRLAGLFEESEEFERRKVQEGDNGATDDDKPELLEPDMENRVDRTLKLATLLVACRAWRSARIAMNELASKPVVDTAVMVAAATAAEQRISQSIQDIDKALDDLK